MNPNEGPKGVQKKNAKRRALFEALSVNRLQFDLFDSYGETPLTSSILCFAMGSIHGEDYLREIDAHIEAGANVDKPNARGLPPIILALTSNESEILLSKLIAAGADVDIEADLGARFHTTPLTRAVLQGDLPSIRSLIDARADVDKSGQYGETPLTAAIYNWNGPESTQAVEMLIEAGADVNKQNARGERPIMKAFRSYGSEILLPMLIEAGADVNEPNARGEPPHP